MDIKLWTKATNLTKMKKRFKTFNYYSITTKHRVTWIKTTYAAISKKQIKINQ